MRAIYDSLRLELRRLEDCSRTGMTNKNITSFFNELAQFLSARIDLIDLYPFIYKLYNANILYGNVFFLTKCSYEKIHLAGLNKQLNYSELLIQIEEIIQRHGLLFSHIALTPIKAIFGLECEILAKLLKAFIELQNLQFLSTLALIYGAHIRLTAWESTLQNREVFLRI